jgi:hypothetical protein
MNDQSKNILPNRRSKNMMMNLRLRMNFLDFFSLVDVASFFLDVFFDSGLAIGFSGSCASRPVEEHPAEPSVEEHDDEFETTDDLPDQLEMVKPSTDGSAGCSSTGRS